MQPADDAAKRFAYENRTWAELPPRQRRFYVWLLLSFVLVAPLARILLQIMGLTESASSILSVALSLIVLAPFGVAARREAKERKAAGLVPPHPPVTRRTLTAWLVAAVSLWVLYAFLFAYRGFLIPALPVVVSCIAALRWTQRFPRPGLQKGHRP